MNSRQLIKYAKDNGYNSVKFICTNKMFTGQFLDAYYEFVKCPLLGEGFTSISQLEETLGYDLEFKIPENEEEYNLYTAMSFSLRGKAVPNEYIGE